jgi:flotillin
MNVGLLGQATEDFPVSVTLLLILLALGVGVVMLFVSRYKRCPSNRVMVIYGKTGKGAARCVHGGAAFVWPLVQAYDYLDLEPFVVPIDLTNALSSENIRVTVPTTVTAAISNEPGIMDNAAVRLLGLSGSQIKDQAQDIILGQMRAVIATMRIEDINADRQAFMAAVNEAVGIEMEKIGLSVINVNIRDIEDESGYITALGRKAAAEAINRANIDVAEEEKLGQTGVAERQRDTRVAVAAANSDAEIGEATADRNRRQRVAGLDAEAVESETEADSKKASYRANQKVAEEEARNRSESAGRQADGAIRVAEEVAERQAEEARAEREKARLEAEVVVPANAEKEKVLIAAEAEREQAVRVARGEADAILARMQAEAEGTQAQLDAKAAGYRELVEACQTGQQAAALLLIEKLTEVAGVQATAIRDLPIEKVIVWDGGNGNHNGNGSGLSGLGSRLMGALPPMHELANQVGLDLPDFLGKLKTEAEKQSAATATADEADNPGGDGEQTPTQ